VLKTGPYKLTTKQLFQLLLPPNLLDLFSKNGRTVLKSAIDLFGKRDQLNHLKLFLNFQSQQISGLSETRPLFDYRSYTMLATFDWLPLIGSTIKPQSTELWRRLWSHVRNYRYPSDWDLPPNMSEDMKSKIRSSLQAVWTHRYPLSGVHDRSKCATFLRHMKLILIAYGSDGVDTKIFDKFIEFYDYQNPSQLFYVSCQLSDILLVSLKFSNLGNSFLQRCR